MPQHGFFSWHYEEDIPAIGLPLKRGGFVLCVTQGLSFFPQLIVMAFPSVRPSEFAIYVYFINNE